MADNIIGANESGGIGTGLAQVFQPFTPQYDVGEFGVADYQIKQTKQKAAQEKQARIGKLAENIKYDTMFPDYQRAYKAKADELLDFVKKGDEEGAMRAKNELAAIGSYGTAIFDQAKAINGTVLGQGVDQFEGLDYLNGLYEGKRKIDINNIADLAQQDQFGLSKVQKKAPPFDVTNEYNQLQGIINPTQEGKRTFIDENKAKESINFAITSAPKWNKFAKEQFMAAPKDVQAKYKGDFVAWGTDNLYKPLLLEKQAPEGKDTNINVNVGGEEGTGVSDVAPQTFDMNLENNAGQSSVTLSFDADGYSFTPVQASRAVPSNTFTLDGRPYTKQGIVNMDIGSVLDMPVANRDINFNGREFKAGQPIPQEYVAFMNKEPNKYRNVIGFKKMATALVDDADQVAFDLNEAENLISTNQKWGKAGYGKYKSNQTKLDTKGRYKELYPNLFGGATQSAPKIITVKPSSNFK